MYFLEFILISAINTMFSYIFTVFYLIIFCAVLFSYLMPQPNKKKKISHIIKWFILLAMYTHLHSVISQICFLFMFCRENSPGPWCSTESQKVTAETKNTKISRYPSLTTKSHCRNQKHKNQYRIYSPISRIFGSEKSYES